MTLVDLLTTENFGLVTAVFATVLSVYNWYQLQRPAKISANEIISFGFISSSYHSGYQLCLPMIFHNTGGALGMITRIEIGFEYTGETKFLEVLGKAKLLETDVNTVYSFDWDSFEKEGYSMILPTYPIAVEPQSSADVTLIAQAEEKDGVLPIGVDSICIVKIRYSKNKTSITKFPFTISEEDSEVDNQLRWLEPTPY